MVGLEAVYMCDTGRTCQEILYAKHHREREKTQKNKGSDREVYRKGKEKGRERGWEVLEA